MIIEKMNSEFYYHFFGGTLTNAYDYFGAHLQKRDNIIIGCEFLVYAPNAYKVCLIGEFNNFNELEMKEINKGFYYIYISGNIEYSKYKYLFYNNNEKIYKSDPYAFYADIRPGNNSIVYDISNFKEEYKLKEKNFNKPISIYEVHLGSWKTKFPKYNELNDLIKYLKDNNFTHLELLPIYEHPLDESWGYMGTGYYAPTSRYAEPSLFYEFIKNLHKNNIGIIIDWVPGHICKDDFGLYKFDGNFLYEYDDYFNRENIEWGTANLDFNKGITQSFLISNAMFWIKKYNIDGFRVDAVRNLIYYQGNEHNGLNKNSINFIKKLNNKIKSYNKNILIIAEDSSDYENVTNENGLNFDYKWNMGWMNDTLKYFELDTIYRKYHHDLITFGFTYCFKENYILPISHDEVVHLKKSLFSKMRGNYFDMFSNMRTFLGLMYTHPGKKLLFMGQEFGVKEEWNCTSTLDFNLLNDAHNKKLQRYFKDLNNLYINEISLHNDKENGFKFIEADNKDQSIFVFARINEEEHVIVIINCLPVTYNNYKVGVLSNNYKEILNSDKDLYGGQNITNDLLFVAEGYYQNQNHYVELNLPALSIVILKNIKQDE